MQPTQFTTLPAKNCRTKRYDQFLGVDFSTDPSMIDGRRSPNAVNLVSDSGGYPEKRMGWEVLQTKAGPTNGLFHFVSSAGQAYFLAHCGTALYAWTDIKSGACTTVSTAMNDARSTATTYGGKLYILDGAKYWAFDGGVLTDIAANPQTAAYTPTTVVGRAPTGGGVPLEAVNLLSPWRRNSFVGNGGIQEVARLQIYNKPTSSDAVGIVLDGVQHNVTALTSDSTVSLAARIAATTFPGWTVKAIGDSVTFTATNVGTHSSCMFNPGVTGTLAGMVTLTPGAAAATTLQLDATGLDAAAVTMTVAGVDKTENIDFTVDRSTGVIAYAAGIPDGGGVDNIVVTFAKTIGGYAQRICQCTIATWFGQGSDSRLFVSGNPAYPNLDWQSGLYDPTYFPDTGYTKIGADSSAVMGYLRQYDSLLIVKEDNDQDATIFQRSAELDGNGVPYFPLKQGVTGIGAISKHAFGSLRDDPLFLAKEGVFAPTLDYNGIKTQRATQSRSYLVNARLTRESNLDTAVAVTWNGLYLLCVNAHVYVADARKKTGKHDTEGYGYEWFYWTDVPARVFLTRGNELFFGDGDGRICRFKSDVDANSRFSDNGQPIAASWASKLDDDGDFMLYKTMPRKGTGVLVKPYPKSSIDVYIRTDDHMDYKARSAQMDIFDWGDIDFTHFTFNTNDASYVIPVNSKVKKYKSVQIVLKNDAVDEGFGCFGIVRRFAVDDYVR